MKIESIIGRRKFLKGTAIFSGLAVLLGVIKPATAGIREAERQPEQPGQGYRLTEHVKKYYETARL